MLMDSGAKGLGQAWGTGGQGHWFMHRGPGAGGLVGQLARWGPHKTTQLDSHVILNKETTILKAETLQTSEHSET